MVEDQEDTDNNAQQYKQDRVTAFWTKMKEQREQAGQDQVCMSLLDWTDIAIGTYRSKDQQTNGRKVFLGPKGGCYYKSITGSRVNIDKVARPYRIVPY